MTAELAHARATAAEAASSMSVPVVPGIEDLHALTAALEVALCSIFQGASSNIIELNLVELRRELIKGYATYRQPLPD